MVKFKVINYVDNVKKLCLNTHRQIMSTCHEYKCDINFN